MFIVNSKSNWQYPGFRFSVTYHHEQKIPVKRVILIEMSAHSGGRGLSLCRPGVQMDGLGGAES